MTCITFNGKHRFYGYGVVTENGVTKRAHRAAWEQAHGPIPKGMVLDHTCHNEAAQRGECKGGVECHHRACINVEHLKLVTQSENVLSGLHSVDVKDSCPQGHSYRNPANIMTRKNGHRECAECNRERARMNYLKRKVA